MKEVIMAGKSSWLCMIHTIFITFYIRYNLVLARLLFQFTNFHSWTDLLTITSIFYYKANVYLFLHVTLFLVVCSCMVWRQRSGDPHKDKTETSWPLLIYQQARKTLTLAHLPIYFLCFNLIRIAVKGAAVFYVFNERHAIEWLYYAAALIKNIYTQKPGKLVVINLKGH